MQKLKMGCKHLLFDLGYTENFSFDLIYQGAFCQRIIENLVEEVCLLIDTRDGNKISRKIFRVFVEMAQNIMHHSVQKNQKGVGIGLIAVINEAELYRIVSCNAVDAEAENILQTKLTLLTGYQDFEYKAVTRGLLKELSDQMHGGAGLGLIDVARSCGRPLIWDFVFQPNVGKSFLLEVEISKRV